MEELIELLGKLNEILKQQILILGKFENILDHEELAISKYEFLEVEKSVVLKTQQFKLMETVEERRKQILKKICYLMAFDCRNSKLSLPQFKSIFETYLNNVKTLLSIDIINKISIIFENFKEIKTEFYSVYDRVSVRISRNKLILKKIIKHVNLSINLFQSESDKGNNYDSLGKSQSQFLQQNSKSSIRVTV